MPLPNFIIIGAMKSGTSTLHSNLQLHPALGMSRYKEPSYFNERYKTHNLDWYKNQFSSKFEINGESSPNYSKKHLYPGTAERMFKLLPNIKLVYLTRDPIERIISHLHHNLYRDRLKYNEINSKVVEDKNYILTSSYFLQIEEYLSFFSKDQILFLTNEEIKRDLNSSLNRICKFVGVSNFDFQGKVLPRNESSDKYVIKNYDFMKSRLNKRQQKIYHWLNYFRGKKVPRPILDEKTILYIKRNLAEDISSFKELTGIEFSNSFKTNFN